MLLVVPAVLSVGEEAWFWQEYYNEFETKQNVDCFQYVSDG